MTLNELFPGAEGKLQFARVVLWLGMPELADFPKDEELPTDLLAKIQQAIAETSMG